MVVRGRRLRLRWKRLVTLAVLTYVGFWSLVSLLHMVSLWNQEAQIRHHIAVTAAQNRSLQKEIRLLQNPTQLKRLLTGQTALPANNLANPVDSLP